uniref:LRRCT domain-containing protein n=1 Tax=Caenorhabditis tropicalis TaxID=1561998 RepID=A0A1I7UDH0_9PELO
MKNYCVHGNQELQDTLNATNFQLARPDLVRTLTIKCPYHSPKVSTPPHSLFQGFRNLDRLELDRCLIDTVPEALFAGLGQLYSLILKNAKIADFPREIFAHTPNLMTLDLSGNRLRIEPYSLRSLHNLIHLDLSDNDIGFLTNTMISLTKLKVITMNNNKITNIDFRRFPENLTDLSIRHNLVSTIHYVPASARNLKRLDLAGNRLEFVAGLSTGAVNVLPAELKHVDLSNNRLNYLHESAFEHLSNLILLDLKNNSLKEVKASSFRGSRYQMKLFLSENTLLCHCNHKWLMDAESKNISIGDLQAIECSNLLKPEKKMLLTLAHSRNQLLCKYSNVSSLKFIFKVK